MYIKVLYKFWGVFFVSVLWFLFSVWFSQSWISDLTEYLPYWFSIYIVSTIALIPGFVTFFFTLSLWLDNRPKKSGMLYCDDITVIVAAFNEELNIRKTVESILNQDYCGKITIIVANDGSIDGTADIVSWFFSDKPQVKLLSFPNNRGKSAVLNDALALVKTDIVLTVDADCWLHKTAIKNIVARYKEDPKNTAAIAGTVLVKNSRKSFWTKIQYHDYFYGISATKRIQSLYGATSVAQGAFSLYKTSVLKEIGGWKECVGEDIVLTWALIAKGYRVGHAEDAFCFTVVPESLGGLIKQRRRWAMGLFETLYQNKDLWKNWSFFQLTMIINLAFILVDFSYIFIFIPGIILALFGFPLIVGPLILLVVLLGSILNICMHKIHIREMRLENLKCRKSRLAYLFYVLFYSFIIQFSSVLGYVWIISRQRKTWGTK